MRATAMAIDPGSSTGIAILLDGSIFTMTVPAQDGFAGNVVQTILRQQPEVIIIERFLSTGKLSRYGIETMELIGVVKALHYLAHFAPGRGNSELQPFELIRRTPSQRSVQIPSAKKYLRERREKLQLSFTDHEVDSLAHLFGWMRANDKFPEPGSVQPVEADGKQIALVAASARIDAVPEVQQMES